jgi:hypothetical protein
MKSLSELADKYEECATANEDTAETILAGLISFSLESQERQSARADWLITEAIALRAKAAELRKMGTAMFGELRDVGSSYDKSSKGVDSASSHGRK